VYAFGSFNPPVLTCTQISSAAIVKVFLPDGTLRFNRNALLVEDELAFTFHRGLRDK